MSEFFLGNAAPARRRIDYSAELNQEQLPVVLGGDGACLVLAGAGSGKTRTLTYRVAYLLERGVDPSSILLLTFTNKAAREMLERVALLAGADAKGIWGGTFHSVAARLLRAFAERLDYRANFSILDADDSQDLIKAVLKDLSIDPKARRFPSASVVQAILSYARNCQLAIAEALEIKHPNFVPLTGEIEEVARRYQRRKKTANVMDFDDLLSNLGLLLDDPQAGASITSAFRYVLVDEYQDTNALQARLVRGLAGPHGNVLVVGDDAQSIYAFRGADVKNILSFPDQWPGAKLFKLLTNYRSTPQILELANDSLAHNEHQFEKELTAVRDAGDKPKLIPCSSAAQEARYVAEQVLALRNQGIALGNMAVLFRSSAHSQSLEFELIKRDIPYEYRGGQKFFERAHIKDIVAYLRVYANPQDEVAWMRVLNLQAGIGAATAQTILSQVRTMTSFDALPALDLVLPARAQSGWSAFLDNTRRMLRDGVLPSAMIRGLLASDYRDYLEREYPNWRERLEDLEQLALFAEAYQDVSRFLADIALYDEVVARREQAGRADEERLILSTIHQAKGLEWDSVFVIHLADNAFPNRRALAEADGMEEERRLFYVAVTRARHGLYLTYPMTTGYDTLMFNQPSTFIQEVAPRLFERVELREAGTSASSVSRPRAAHEPSWDETGGGWEEPSIQIEARSARRAPASPTVWKSSSNKPKPSPRSP